ncbi:putative glycine betaine transporter [Eubacterium callanderi]|uniref:BCCT family transporter n=1 Tax=Eubacterium callanderi TaxID=53442 RepID=UPI0029FF3481|nr:BCCT family transporter [Eubacterium callanderi]WPK69200.1 putative glycine betaine transporter [Eubacterium callanderi]WPK73498.1 putative glycine betaine transporter [Eubacterium callanderi]
MKKNWLKMIDPYVAIPAFAILFCLIGWAVISPQGMGETVTWLFNFLTNGFGWVYLFLGVVFLFFCIWLAFGPYRNVKLGPDDSKPEHSNFSWFSMIVACGYGVGLVYWCVAEPLTFLDAPPMGMEPYSAEAAVRAISQTFLHWGWIPWAIYMVVGVTMGYFMFRKKVPPFFSAALRPLFGDKVDKKGFRVFDGFIVYGVIAGVTTATGLGIMQLASGLHSLFGIPENNLTYIIIAVAWAVLITVCTVSGLDKGIKLLSNINIPLAAFLCIVVFVLGPIAFIMNTFCSAIGDLLGNFFPMALWTDSVGQTGFAQGWTIFYWAWWIASAPSTGLFVANISKGRTIKEVVMMHLAAAPLATFFWYATFGASGLFKQLFENAAYVATMNELGTQSAVFTLLADLPFGQILSALFLILIFIFLATTVDGYAYVCAQVATKEEDNPLLPSKGLRAAMALAISTLALTMIMIGEGQIKTLQSSSVLGSIVILVMMVLLIVSMVKSMKQDEMKGLIDVDALNRRTPEIQNEKNVEKNEEVLN